jgi:hypothetical protein
LGNNSNRWRSDANKKSRRLLDNIATIREFVAVCFAPRVAVGGLLRALRSLHDYALRLFFRWFNVNASFEGARHFLFFERGLSLLVTILSVLVVFQLAAFGRIAKRPSRMVCSSLMSVAWYCCESAKVRPRLVAMDEHHVALGSRFVIIFRLPQLGIGYNVRPRETSQKRTEEERCAQ